MAIELPVLDDKRFADLFEEARASISKHYPAWTDHNPSDPGMTLVELFAWLTDILLYRTGRLPDDRYLAFLRLLGGPDFKLSPGQTLDDGIRQTLGVVRELYRAVSVEDYELLTALTWPKTEAAAGLDRIARVKCIPARNLGASDKLALAPAYMSLLVLPAPADLSTPWVGPSAALTQGLSAFFANRKLLTTRLCVAGPTYVSISIGAKLYLKDFGQASDIKAAASAALQRFFHPLEGGGDRLGFPFGGEINVSKIYAILDGIRGVEYTEGVTVTAAGVSDRRVTDGDELLTIELLGHELPRLDAQSTQFTLMVRSGDKWKAI